MAQGLPAYDAELQFIGVASRKFYKVRVFRWRDDTLPFDHWRVRRTWGRLGTQGQMKDETVKGRANAIRSAKELVDAKLAKGYALMLQTEQPKAALARCEVIDASLVRCAGHIDTEGNCDNCGMNAKTYRAWANAGPFASEDEMRAVEEAEPRSFAEQFQAFAKGIE